MTGPATVSAAQLSERQIIAAMPKTELHVHLDGCMRLSTIADLARRQGIELPVPASQLRSACVVPDECRSLAEYLDRFVVPLMVLQKAEALERAVYELCEDAMAENVRYIEPRFAPTLHLRSGLNVMDAIAAACRGWHVARKSLGVSGGLIICAMRHRTPNENLELARAGERFLGDGVVGFDIAGDEAPHPILAHSEALLYAQAAGYGMTAHAGEGAGADSVRAAVEVIGVSRIGHGTRSNEDPGLLEVLRDRRICLDMCPYSNVQTKSVKSLGDHPIRQYFDFGIPVTVSTDSRTCSDTTVSREMARIHRAQGFTPDELWQMTRTALEVGFADRGEREGLLTAYETEIRSIAPDYR